MFEKLNALYEKIKKWYSKQPLYLKILLFVPLIAVGVLLVIPFVLSTPLNSGNGIKEHENMIDEEIESLKDNIDLEKAEIAERKKYILKNLDLADKIDADILKRKERILTAGSLAELDKLQEEFEL